MYDEEKFKALEKEKTDEMEVAAQKDEERKEKKKDEGINLALIFYFILYKDSKRSNNYL